MGAVDGGVVGILTKRLFDGHVDETVLDWVVATLAAAQGFANISSFLWSAMSHGRHKIRFITALKIAIVLMIAGVAFVPQTELGLLTLLLFVVANEHVIVQVFVICVFVCAYSFVCLFMLSTPIAETYIYIYIYM